MVLKQKRILVVEDESSIYDNIQFTLSKENFHNDWAQTGKSALEYFSNTYYDLILLDIGLPDMDGFEILKSIRKTSEVPVLFLSARQEEIDKVLALELGGDDYLSKPFSPREMLARIKAILRRVEKQSSQIITTMDPSIFQTDEDRYKILYQGKDLELTVTEFKILKVFLSRPGRIYTRDQIMQKVWDDPDASLERSIDAHVKSIRAKINQINSEQEIIITHRGIGYSLAENL